MTLADKARQNRSRALEASRQRKANIFSFSSTRR